jgi:hypothetical protein
VILKDDNALNEARNRDRCEWCGKTTTWTRFQAAHIFTRGAGQVDIPENLLGLCCWCHAADQDAGGKMSKLLMQIVSGHRECLLAFVCGGEDSCDWSDIAENVFAVRRLPKEQRCQ